MFPAPPFLFPFFLFCLEFIEFCVSCVRSSLMKARLVGWLIEMVVGEQFSEGHACLGRKVSEAVYRWK